MRESGSKASPRQYTSRDKIATDCECAVVGYLKTFGYVNSAHSARRLDEKVGASARFPRGVQQIIKPSAKLPVS